ncbi:MAG: outer membrane lipoprotein carrier protein LolA [Pseudomonadota bacterium]
MKRRDFLATGVAAAAVMAAGPVTAQAIPLDRISSYFNAIETLQAKFAQFNPDGTIASGTLYIRRPGRMRFEYDPPQRALVMAGAGQLAIFDGRSNESRPEQYPLRRTPLNILLERDVRLGANGVVVGHSGDASATRVIARDPQRPEMGWIEFVFAERPLRMTEWTVVDDAGQRTRTVLSELRTGVQLANSLFSIQDETNRRNQ